MASVMCCGASAMPSSLPFPPMASSFSRSPELAIRIPAIQAPSFKRRRQPVRLAAASGDVVATGSDVRALPFDIARLEQYTEKVKGEVLRVHAVVDGEEDQVIIFKGFSSSLMRPTAYDPAEPVLPPSATIRAIDRIRGPFNPAKVLLIKGGKGLTWEQFQASLEEKGL